jgi:hypothetical protein
MTAAEIRALITSYLASNSSITAVKHRAIENALIDYSESTNSQLISLSEAFLATLPKNKGYVSGFNPGSGGTLTTSGNILTAVITNIPESIINVTIQNAMPSMNYIVKGHLESMGDLDLDNVAGNFIFKKINTTSFQISVGEWENVNQNLKIHLEVISLD